MNGKQIEEEYRIHTSADNESAELVKMTCTNCGASLTVTDKTHAKCPFCGQTYLIDEAKGIVVNVSVDYGDSVELKRSVKNTRRMIIGFFIAALFITAVIFAVNMAANHSAFSSSDSDVPLEENGNLMVIFCKDIFQKEYDDITPEEFASIRYIKYDFQWDADGDYSVIEYSFTNYEDCGSEEEFLDTVQTWSYDAGKSAPLTDVAMLTGLTRIDTTAASLGGEQAFSEDCKISYVATDDRLEAVSAQVNPKYVKVLDMKAHGNSLSGLEQYENLEALRIEDNDMYNTLDFSGIGKCSRLKQIELDCRAAYEGLEEIAKLPELKYLSINRTLSDRDFSKQLPQLEELTMKAGEEADLSFLSCLPNLKKLDMGSETVASVEPLLKLTRLEELTISVDTPEDIVRLAELKQLKKLHLNADCGELNFYGLKDENYQKPLDISVLSGLPELKEIYISCDADAGVSGAESVLNMPGLVSFGAALEQGDFNISPEQLAENSSLEIFCLKGANICNVTTGEEVDFNVLSNYPNLKELWLQDLRLEDIHFISQLGNLQRCHLEGTGISDFSPLKECKKLEYLCLGIDPSEERPDVAEEVEVEWGMHEFGKEQ